MQLRQKNRRSETTAFEPGNILRIEAQSNYCKIFSIDRAKTMVVSKVLHRLQEKLPADMFIRVHRSHLVNRQYIKQVSGNHTKTAELINGESIPVSRRKQTEIVGCLSGFCPEIVPQMAVPLFVIPGKRPYIETLQ